MYVSSTFHVSVMPPSPHNLEILTLSVLFNNFKVYLCIFYRPPSSSSSIFDNLFSYLDFINVCSLNNFILLGDFNVNFDNPCHPMYSSLCNLTTLYCLYQSVTGPTHVHHDGSESTIDLVFVSESSLLNTCDTIPPLSNSDHRGILMEISRKIVKAEKTQGRLIWRYGYADWDKACDLINQFDWDSILSENVELSWKLWHKQFMSIMAQSIPNRVIPTRRNLPWLNRGIIKSMKKRNQLFKKAKRTGNFHHFKLARNRTVAQLRLAKRRYFQALNPKDPKKFWKAIKFLNKSKQSIPTLSLDGRVANSEVDKANLLNSYFSSCFNRSHPPVQYQSTPAGLTSTCPEEFLCSEPEVYDFLAALDTTKASGPDGLSARMLKCTAPNIAPSLTKLFNLSISTGTIPLSWKKSLIVPIPKCQELSSPCNYRPVSLLPIVSKILERHIYMLLMDHLNHSHPLSALQWGFLEGRSTVTALLHLTDQWLQALEEGLDICAVFFDFRKAFDSVPHLPLMDKIRSLDLHETISRWINNYLANRTQVVAVNGSESSVASVLSGVPQGSVLGPLLFLIYIDDLPGVVQNFLSKVNLFADDILLYHLISVLEDYATLQRAISLIEEWSITNFLNFNAAKCKYMIISRKRSPPSPEYPLRLFGCPMQSVDCYKYLGLLITNNLTWSTHIDSVCSRAKKILGLIYRRFYSSANQDTLKQLYTSLVRPHLEYACQVWDPHLVKDKKALEDVQKFGCRLAAYQWDLGYQELLNLFELQSLEQRRLDLKLGLMFKIIHRLCYFPDIPDFRQNLSNLRVSHPLQLDPPFARTNAYKFSYFPHTMSAWNSLNNNCVTCTSYTSFMKQLKFNNV